MPRPGAKPAPTAQKLRGGYYTPPQVAAAVAAWAVRTGCERVLEPSAGDGALVAPALARLGLDGALVAVEHDPAEAARIATLGDARVEVVVGDFFGWLGPQPAPAFDAVVGNPPFVRYQDFAEAHRTPAFALMRTEGLNPSRLTNAWLPFVVGSTLATRPGGRVALVLPAELLQVGYAAELRGWLARRFTSLTLVTFRRLVFHGLQQEIVLLLGERGDVDAGRIEVLELEDASELPRLAVRRSTGGVAIDHAREKWTRWFLTPGQLGLVRELEAGRSGRRLGEVAEVDVGVVTGRNAFFVLTPSEADRWGVRDRCLPVVGRSAQLPGLAFGGAELEALVAADARCLLLQLGKTPRESLSAAARAYVEHGEGQGHHAGFKCAIRQPTWWHVPSVWTPDAFLLRQIHDAPRIVANRTAATATDTLHRVRARPGGAVDDLVVGTLNAATLTFAEIKGRSYGGGVLELEPTEAEDLWFPSADALAAAPPADELDALVRRGGVEAALDVVDTTVLRAGGLTAAEIEVLRGAWRSLSGRRRGRGRGR